MKLSYLLPWLVVSAFTGEAQITYENLYDNTTFNSRNITLKPVGSTAGVAGVSATGAATYTIPIWCPPGTNGMTPQIALVYNSQGGNGIMGMGWSISGLSAITRVNKDIYHDGEVTPVYFDGRDKFALDGTRMILKSGYYGATWSEYALETEDFSNITYNLYGSVDFFSVRKKDGTLYEYGNTDGNNDDACLRKNGGSSPSLLWSLKRITDVNGNSMEFSYYKNESNRRLAISEIKYTKNDNQGLTPYYKIKFNTVGGRVDESDVYVGGSAVNTGLLLESVVVADMNNNPIKTYGLRYGKDEVNSYLIDVTEKNQNNAELNSIQFKYGDIPSNAPITNIETGNVKAHVNRGYPYFFLDLQGDGVKELIKTNGTNINGDFQINDFQIYSRNQTTGSYSLEQTVTYGTPKIVKFNYADGYTTKQYHDLSMSDMNGDGREDIVILETTPNSNYLKVDLVKIFLGDQANYLTSNPVTLTPSPTWNGITMPNSTCAVKGQNHIYMMSGDFDGNKKSDILVLFEKDNGGGLSDHYPTVFSYENGQIIQKSITGIDFTKLNHETFKAQIIDIDGDGKTEILLMGEPYSYVYTLTKQSNGNYVATETAGMGLPTRWHHAYTTDFNGDGKTDLLIQSGDGLGWEKAISNGINFNYSTFSFTHLPKIEGVNTWWSPERDNISIGDFNGDSKSDIIHIRGNGTNQIYTYLSRGNTFEIKQTNSWTSRPVHMATYVSDINGDGVTDVLSISTSNTVSNENYPNILFYYKNTKHPMLEKAADGLANVTRFEYQPLSSGVNYQKGTGLSYPFVDIQPAFYVVQRMFQPDGLGSSIQTNYNYEGAFAHLEGRGLLGFKKFITHNLSTGMKSETIADFDSNYDVSYVKEVNAYNAIANQQISHTVNNIAFVQGTVPTQSNAPGSFYQQLTSQTQQNLLTSSTTTTTNTYNNNYGTISSSTTDINGIETITTATTYTQAGNSTIPCMPNVVTVTKQRTGEVSVNESTKYNYDGSGRVSTRYDRWGATGYVVQNDFSYDDYGNIAQTIVSGTASVTKTMEYEYDPLTNRFPVKVTNAGMSPSQISTSTWDPVWGKPLTQTDVDGIITTNTYDNWGKLTSTKIKTGLPEEETITYTDGWESGGNSYYTLTSHPTKPDVKTWYDKLGRVIKTKTEHLNNQWTESTRTYDSKGNVLSETAPKLPSESAFTTNYYYNDPYNRLTSTTNNFGTTNYSYSFPGNGQVKTTVTNPAGQDKTSTVDAAGKTTRETDNGGFLDYSYDSWGNITEVNNTRTTVMTHSYNAYGIKTNTYDISAGITRYEYNAFGQLTEQTDANNCTHRFLYNALGQVTTRSGPEGTTTYTYNQAGSGATNQLASITGFGTNPVNESFYYDYLGRISQKNKYFDGTSYASYFDYDANDNLIKKQYSDGFELNYSYNNGFLESVYNNSQTFFKSPVYNGQGQVTQYELGNGRTTINTYYHGYLTRTATPGVQDLEMTYDYTTGNLTKRNEHIKLLRENFKYDDLNRLTESYVEGYGSSPFTTTPININYDVANQGESKGNIIQKSDAGTFGVNYFMQTTQTRNEGQLIGLNTQDITYTCFRKTATVTETLGHYANGVQYPYTQTFTYDAGYNRVMTEMTGTDTLTNNSIHLKRHYLDDYEVTQDLVNMTTTYVHYIAGADGLCAIAEGQSMGSPTYHYIYKDHLGSLVAATDGSGTIEIEQNFDAWGRERDPQNWLHGHGSLPGVGLTNSWLYRGYTGHEHMPYFSMINMNGRMYDPIQGRMMSPDPYIMPGGTQGYNRYAYCLNNPLKYTDPTGEYIVGAIIVGAVVGAYMGGVLANNGDYTPWGKTSSESWDMNGKTWGYMAGGAIVGGISAGVGAAISASGGIMANTMGIMMSSAINSFGTTLYTGGQTDPSVSFGAGSYNFKKGTARGIWDWNDLSTMERIGYTAGALANTQDLVALFGSSTSYTVGSHVTKNDKTGHSYGYSQNVDDNIDISVASSKGWNPGGKTPGTTGHEARYLLQKFIPHKGRYFGSLRYHGKPGNSEITLYNVNKNILQNMTKRILGGLDPVSGGDLLYGFLNGCQSHVGRSLWAVGIPTLPINFHPYVLTLQLAIRQAAIQSSGILITR